MTYELRFIDRPETYPPARGSSNDLLGQLTLDIAQRVARTTADRIGEPIEILEGRSGRVVETVQPSAATETRMRPAVPAS